MLEVLILKEICGFCDTTRLYKWSRTFTLGNAIPCKF